jgi:hypothetical protein
MQPDENGQLPVAEIFETPPVTLELLDGKVDEIKAMLLEVLMWKTELESAMSEMQGGGLLSVFSKMFGAKQ